ncbi:Transcriptional regulatory protein moc3-like protein 7 [Colletotrichum chlorophyti]|uniref:Transcriptional regulatory protein moc3-like protein 7 n=1 Tax=Colletotrichum chlorophyti TaxID=708187 RepID=A0A1Q8S0S1_9PEZI|nr:Transcriptional regulatory protein moc3-like protein 7 [Colletotrichum chlorophyti]
MSTSSDQRMTEPGSAPPASLQSQPSGRKGSKKVRTGIRKVKCDETKPACIRCTKTGRKCDGYISLPNASASGNGGCPGPEHSGSLLCPPMSAFGDWSGGIREQRAFDFYRNFSAPSIFGEGVGSTLWNKLVPHFCHAEPSIRHAVLAISSLHESFTQVHSTVPGNAEAHHVRSEVLSNTFAAEQYGKALKYLQEWRPTESSPATVPLLACLLFICIEFMLGDEGASQLHINQGRLILSQLEPSSEVDVIKKHFVPIYSRLSLASFLFGSFPAAIPQNLKSSPAATFFFASVDEAEVALYEIIDDGLRFTAQGKRAVYSLRPDDPELVALARERDDFLARLSRWHVAFVVALAMDDALKKGKLCLVYYHAARISIGTALAALETSYDSHLQSFASIVSNSAEFVHATRKATGRDPSRAAILTPKFVFDTEVIPPLYYVAVKCRHPMLRRAAVDLLRQDAVMNRMENLWDARMLAEIGKRCIDIEEEAARQRETSSDITAGWDTASWSGTAGIPTRLFPDLSIPTESHYPVSRFQYPGMPKSVNQMLNEEYDADLARSRQTTPGSVSTRSSTSSGSSWTERHMEPPFGLPECARIKNALIDNESKRGSWVTIFMDPTESGAAHWKVTKEFVKR